MIQNYLKRILNESKVIQNDLKVIQNVLEGILNDSKTVLNDSKVIQKRFKIYLNRRLRIENEQISTPLPAIAEKMPPKKPVKVKTKACQIPKLGTASKVRRLCCRFSKYKAKAKLNQTQTNPSFLVGGSNKASKYSKPNIIPNAAPRLQKIIECHSNLIFIQKIVKAAAVIPKNNFHNKISKK